MRMELHTVKVPTWTQSEYGEPVPSYSAPTTILMMVGWNSMTDQENNGSLYKDYQFVGLTRADVPEDALIDDTYVVGHVEAGRWNRVFMRYADGKDRDYGND